MWRKGRRRKDREKTKKSSRGLGDRDKGNKVAILRGVGVGSLKLRAIGVGEIEEGMVFNRLCHGKCLHVQEGSKLLPAALLGTNLFVYFTFLYLMDLSASTHDTMYTCDGGTSQLLS